MICCFVHRQLSVAVNRKARAQGDARANTDPAAAGRGSPAASRRLRGRAARLSGEEPIDAGDRVEIANCEGIVRRVIASLAGAGHRSSCNLCVLPKSYFNGLIGDRAASRQLLSPYALRRNQWHPSLCVNYLVPIDAPDTVIARSRQKRPPLSTRVVAAPSLPR